MSPFCKGCTKRGNVGSLFKKGPLFSPFFKGGPRGIFSRVFIIKVNATTLSPLGTF